jgi:drug/metabolite transporter (DMT)-like permease
MPYLSFLFICFVWGSSFILVDRAAHALGPVAIGMFRLLGGSIVLGLYWAYTRHKVQINARDFKHICVVAAIANAWPFVVLPYVMTQADEHAYFGMMVALVPLVTILATIPMLGIWPTPRQLIGVLGGLICMVGVVLDGSQRGIPLGVLVLGLTVPITYALGNTYIKWKLDHLHPLPLTVMFLGAGGLMLAPLWFWPAAQAAAGIGSPAQPHDWPVAIASIILLAVIGTGLTIWMFIHLVKHQGPLFAGMVTYVIPVLALAWGQFDGETLTSLQLSAMAGVLMMVGLVQWGAAGGVEKLPEPLFD